MRMITIIYELTGKWQKGNDNITIKNHIISDNDDDDKMTHERDRKTTEQ